MKLHPMVTFSGNCRQALEFYRECLGGELYFEGLPDAHKAGLPSGLRDIVLRAKWVSAYFTVYASDLGETTARGRISLLVDSGNADEVSAFFKKLARNGKVFSELGSGGIGAVVDSFGVEWLFVGTGGVR